MVSISAPTIAGRPAVAPTDTRIGNLSGGNQQKALVGRWLIGSYQALLLEEPTRGADIGAKVEIYKEINALAQDGLPVIMYSSELLELIGLCDRVIVVRGGSVSAVLSGEGRRQGQTDASPVRNPTRPAAPAVRRPSFCLRRVARSAMLRGGSTFQGSSALADCGRWEVACIRGEA